MKATRLIALSCLLFPLASATAEDPPSPSTFDTSQNGTLEELEFARLQLKARDPKLSALDKNGDLKVEDKELLAWARPYWLQIAKKAPAGSASFDLAKTASPKPETSYWSLEPFRFGKDHEALVAEVKDADPASLGFYRNNLTGEDTWSVEGALGAVFDITGRERMPQLGNYTLEPLKFIPSASLNRVTGTGDGTLETADALVFRSGLAFNLAGNEDALWEYQTLSAAGRAVGSTQGGDLKWGGELEWTPIRSKPGDWISINGPLRAPFGRRAPFRYRFLFSGRAEGGESESGNSFLKIGSKVGLLLTPNTKTSFDRLQLFANYTYLWEVASSERDFDYLETGFRWQLDQGKQVFLEGKYRFGQLPAKYTDIDVFQLSLAVKF